jgi:hypothetical protein
MRIVFTLLFGVMGAINANAQPNPPITNFNIANTGVFTSNNFKCIGVGKGNRIWAGTQYGGLYTYDEGFNIWRKSDKLTNVFINDIKADADSGIWIAQSGTASVGGNSNIAGGVNYFPVASDISMSFYSVQGTTTSADLLSRNVRSLYIDQSWGAANNRLPRVWAAQGTYITSFNTRRGGLSVGLNPNPVYFSKFDSGYATAPNATPISEAVGGNNNEVWVAARQNNGGSQILRYRPSGIYIGTFSHANVPALPNGFSAQAIHFDIDGNRWIGLKSGGLVIQTPSGWKKMDAPSFFQPSTQINFNAMASDKYGNVYIGTSTGLLVYKGRVYNPSSSPDFTPSYDYYTTNNGLPSNNITGLAYDNKNSRLLITSDAGVSFMDLFEPYIKGVVLDAFCDLDNAEKKIPGFQTRPLPGVTTVRLLKNGVEEEFVFPDANGIFELKEANDEDVYSVEVKSVIEGRTIKYVYNNIKNHTKLIPSMVPDGLIKELIAFKPKLEQRCFPLKLSFGLEIDNLLCTNLLGSNPAFNTSNFDAAYREFYRPEGLTDFQKRLDNLAASYLAMHAVYTMGGNATDLAADGVTNIFDAMEALAAFAEFGIGLRQPAASASLEAVGEDAFKGSTAVINALKDAIMFGLSKLSRFVNPDNKKFFDLCVTSIEEVTGLIIVAFEKGSGSAKTKLLVDILKKLLAQTVAISAYKSDYAQDHHQYFVPTAVQSARNLASPHSYQLNYDNVCNPNSNSIVKEAQDKYQGRKDNITLLGDIAKGAAIVSNGADAASLLALAGGPATAAAVKVFSFAVKGLKVLAHAGAIYQANEGFYETIDMSDGIQPRAGLSGAKPIPNITKLNIGLQLQDSLIARKNRYNQRLTELQVIYNAAYNLANYKSKRQQLVREDSLYNASVRSAMHALYSTADSALVRIPNFESRLNRVADSFVDLQYTLRNALYYQNIAYILAPDKTIYAPGLDSLSNEIKLANDSAVNGIVSLVNLVNGNSIPSLPYLVQESYKMNHSGVPGSSGQVVYSFKNHGSTPQQNVRFKISQPGSGYSITSADSVNVGTIAPGETKQISFNFQSPLHDSLVHYTIAVMADNGIYRNAAGVLYVIDPTKFYSIKNGNWNDPATWSNNAVPVATSQVYIGHAVTVTANVTCKSITAFQPGNVTVNAGQRIVITN